jgi:hypothetical protein
MGQPSPARLEKMAIRRHIKEPGYENSSDVDSLAIESRFMYTISSSPSSCTASISPSPSPELSLPEVHVAPHNSSIQYHTACSTSSSLYSRSVLTVLYRQGCRVRLSGNVRQCHDAPWILCGSPTPNYHYAWSVCGRVFLRPCIRCTIP